MPFLVQGHGVCAAEDHSSKRMMLVTVSDATTAKEGMHWQNVLIHWPLHCSIGFPW